MHVLKLGGTLASELGIEMLARAAERLSPLGRFFSQALGMWAIDLVEQSFVEVVAIAGDFWQELRQGDGGVEAFRAFAADAAGHENGSGENGGGFLQQFVRGNVGRVG